MRPFVFKASFSFSQILNFDFLLTISPLPSQTILSRLFEKTRWHAIIITTLFWGGGVEGGSKYQVSRIFAPDCLYAILKLKCISEDCCLKIFWKQFFLFEIDLSLTYSNKFA